MWFIVTHLKIYSIHIYDTFKSISSTYTGSMSLPFLCKEYPQLSDTYTKHKK